MNSLSGAKCILLYFLEINEATFYIDVNRIEMYKLEFIFLFFFIQNKS